MAKNTPFSSSLPFSVILVAAGHGARFGDNLPKQYHTIHGKTVLQHTIERFLEHPALTHIQVVIADGFQDIYKTATAGLPKLLPPALGGATRQESVYNALQSLNLKNDDIILIHDAARPCVSIDCVDTMIGLLKTEKAASLATPVTDTLRKSTGKSKDKHLSDMVDRTDMYAMQTPQGFHFGIIKEAHNKFKGQNYTDDTALVTEMGVPVHIVDSSRDNIKITLPEDLKLAEKLMNIPLIPRTGLGFDVHAFGDAASSIRIGGMDIPHTHKLKGHSDADVLLHAMTDALYGTIADGDIGSHFPPSDPEYKGKDSAFFLEDAVNAVKSRGGKIVHIDSVIMCEAPKIGPHRAAIQTRVANIVGIAQSKVSIKATTTEELGFTGRREGIAAQAIVTVLFPDSED